MTESSNTNSRRDSLKTAALMATGALAGMLSSSKANGQASEAGVAVVIKQTYDKWIKVYNDAVAKADSVRREVRNSVSFVEDISKIEKTLFDQKAHIKKTIDAFYAFKGNPLGATFPNLTIESQPLFSHLKKSINYLEALTKSKSVSDSDRSKIRGSAKSKAYLALGKNDAIQQRKTIMALKKRVGGLKSNDRSKASILKDEAAPILMDQNQAILESLLRIESIMTDFYSEVISKTPIEHKNFGKKELQSAQKRYESGDGAIPDLGVE